MENGETTGNCRSGCLGILVSCSRINGLVVSPKEASCAPTRKAGQGHDEGSLSARGMHLDIAIGLRKREEKDGENHSTGSLDHSVHRTRKNLHGYQLRE